MVDSTGRTVLTNAAYTRFFGESEFEALDDLGDELPPDETPQMRVAGGERFTTEFSAVAHDGARHRFRVRGMPINGGDGGGGVIVVHEIEEG